MFAYIKRITQGGPKMFLERLRKSRYGLDTVSRTLSWRHRRQKVIKRYLASMPSIEDRKDLQALLSAPALINDPEIAVFKKYAPYAEKNIVEIGCAYGGSSLLFLIYKNNQSQLYSMDPFIQDSMGEFQASQDICYNQVTKALKDLGLVQRMKDWNLIPDYSYNYVKKWTLPIDVLFIDGDHRYEAVKKDFDDWYPFVKKGGIIFFHDSCKEEGLAEGKYVKGWPGPTKFVKELLQDKRVMLLEQIHSISVFKKE